MRRFEFFSVFGVIVFGISNEHIFVSTLGISQILDVLNQVLGMETVSLSTHPNEIHVSFYAIIWNNNHKLENIIEKCFCTGWLVYRISEFFSRKGIAPKNNINFYRKAFIGPLYTLKLVTFYLEMFFYNKNPLNFLF